jgi:hypothetical protein
MKFRLSVEMDNDAFGQNDWTNGQELARLLREVADRVAAEVRSGTARDSNGNSVGAWSIVGKR